MDWFIRIVCAAAICTLVYMGYDKKWLAELFAVVGIVIAVAIPIQIDTRDRAIQRLENCTGSVLGLREKLLEYYRLKVDEYGNVDDSESQQEGIPAIRTRMLNAKDSTYTLCANIRSEHGLILDPSKTPWLETPIAITNRWSKANVSGLYAWSTEALKQGTEIEPAPVMIPFTTVPVLP
jgi:type II secretory pathway pseudopilin PulG